MYADVTLKAKMMFGKLVLFGGINDKVEYLFLHSFENFKAMKFFSSTKESLEISTYEISGR